MLTIAFCQDSPRAREGRQRQFVPHVRHLQSVMSSIRLAAPLATADGAAISDDHRLVASVFAIESPTFAAASELMAADPYTSQDVWRCVSLFTVDEEYGRWLTTDGLGKSPQHTYAAFSSGSGTGHATAFAGSALFGARLKLAGALGEAALCRHWQSITLLSADSLDAANSMVARASASLKGTQSEQVWAIPLAVGSWPGRTRF